MKAMNFLWISLVTALLVSGCYDDKGNYEYNGIAKITIDLGTVYDIALGDILHVEPTITFSKEAPDLKLAYKWILEGDVISTERNLNWVSDRFVETGPRNLIFEVLDVENDLLYRSSLSMAVKDKYDVDGFLVLAEKGGGKKLHLIRQTYDEEWNEIYIPLLDPYGLENEGEVIPASSFKMHEHYCRQGAFFKNQVMLVADDQTFEIEGASFKKVPYTISDMFNGVVPADLQNSVKDVFFMERLDLISDTKGQLYSRLKSTFEIFHSDYFLSTPVSYKDEVLKDIDIIPSSYGCGTPFCLLYDKKKERFLVIWDYQDDKVFLSGKIQEIPNSTHSWPEGIPVANDICKDYIIHSMVSYKRDVYESPAATRYFCIVENKTSKEYFVYDFGLKLEFHDTVVEWATKQEGTGEKVDATMQKIPDDVLSYFTSPDHVIYTLPWGQNGWCTLIAQGRDLYVYNRKAPLAGSSEITPNPRKVDYAFDSEIAVMNAETYCSNSMGVAFKDGTFQVLDIADISQGRCRSTWKSAPDLNLGTPASMFFHTTGNLNLDWRDEY